MSFSFKYRGQELENGSSVSRPVIPLKLGGNGIGTIGLVDSGSDISIIPKEIAELADIKLEKETNLYGLGKVAFKVYEGSTSVEIGKVLRERQIFEIPVYVFAEKIPGEQVILGRAGFFDKFKISFEQNRRINLKYIREQRY